MLVGLTVGCGETTQTQTAPTAIELPETVETLSVPVTKRDLPNDWGEHLVLVTTVDEVLVGGGTGLFALTANSLTRLDPNPVLDLAVFGGGVVVARPAGNYFWKDGVLGRSPLSDVLSDTSVAALSAAGETLWLGTSSGVWAYSNDRLSHMMDGPSIRRVSSTTNGKFVTMEDSEGAVFALEPADDEWAVLELTADGVTELQPTVDSLYALIGGRLHRMVSEGTSTVWRQIGAAGDSTDAIDGISNIQTQNDGAGIWLVTDTEIVGVLGNTRRTLERGDDLEEARLILDASNRPWLFGNGRLAVYSEAEVPSIDATWAGSIKEFADTNCTRCHGPLGTAIPLHTLEQWKELSTQIIEELTAGRMPLDGAELIGGDVELIRAWVEGGQQ